MTRAEFRDTFKHELLGMLLDAAITRKSGAELSLDVVNTQHKLSVLLDRMYDSLSTDPINNGKQPTKVRP
jgi:DNA repair protein RadC